MHRAINEERWSYYWKKAENGQNLVVFMLNERKVNELTFGKHMTEEEKQMLDKMFIDDGYIKSEESK